MTVRLAVTLVLIFCAAMECLTQESPRPQKEPVLKVEATAVVVDVIVTDRKGRHVPGLTASDFKLSEDNSPQTIESFTSPVARTRPQQVENGKAAPAAEAPSAAAPKDTAATKQARTPQLITLVIDLGDLHPESLKRACAASAKFAEKTIAEGNLIAIYWVDTSLHLGLPFTRERKRALEVLESLKARLPSGRFTALERERTQNELDEMKYESVAMPTNPGAGPPPPDPMAQARNIVRSWITTANTLQARTIFVALRAMALAYRDLPGRKSVVVFSEGFLHALDGEAEIEAVIDATNRSHVAIYVIDASGMALGAMDGKDPMSVKRRTYDSQFGRDIGEGPRGRVAGGLGEFDWVQTLGSDRHGDLGAIATATGGFLIKDTNDLGPALDRVEDDASEFYTLVYSPSNYHYDGAFRKIKVELAEPDYRLRYRQGYWALPPGRAIMMTPAAAQLLAAVESGQHTPSFTPQLNAVLVPAADGRFGVSAAVSMLGKLVRFDKLKDQYVAGVSVLLIARDVDGKLLAVHERYGDVRLNRKEHEEFSSRTFNLQGNVPIPELQPVSVQAIVRLVDGTLGVTGRKNLDPGRGSSNLRLTSLVLSNREDNTACNPNSVEPLCVQGARILLPAQPQFDRSATMTVYCSVLGVSLDSAQKPHLGISFSLRSGDALNPFKPKQQLIATPGNVPHAYLVMAAFDLQSLQPGTYKLEMTAEDKIQSERATESTELAIQ
jgi:VWFA-related protein